MERNINVIGEVSFCCRQQIDTGSEVVVVIQENVGASTQDGLNSGLVDQSMLIRFVLAVNGYDRV